MKIYNLRISRSIGISTAALLSVIFYLSIIIVLNLSQNVIDPTGENYSTVFGIAQLVIVTLYWVLINYFYFSRPGKSGFGTILVYLLFMLFPIICFSVATIVLQTYYPITDFILSWNLMTWVIGPTLFWYLPYSYIYYVFGYNISMSLFIIICLAYNICIIGIGIILGLIRRSYVVEKNEALKRSQLYSQYDVSIDSVAETEMVTNINNASDLNSQEIDLNGEPVPTSILEIDETDILNEEIDKLNNQEEINIQDDK